MKAIILAAGVASRLRPLTDGTPKCLLPIGNTNILALTLTNLQHNGIKDVIIVTGYLQEQIINFVQKNFHDIRIQFIHNEVYDSTNNIYSLWLAKKELENENFLLLDSDIVFHPDIVKNLLNSNYPCCLALKKHDVGDEEIKVKVDKRYRVQNISKIVIPGEALGESIGIELFDAKTAYKLFEVIERLCVKEKRVNLFYEVAFEEIIQQGAEMFVVDITHLPCMEMDTVEDFQKTAPMVASIVN